MDLSLSLDNVVAAVALDKRLWVVCTGVFIGILALRFFAGYCITLIEKFPILKHTAFLLIGFVGVILLVEIMLEYTGIHFHIDSIQKFFGILAIIAATLWYERSVLGRKALTPVVNFGRPVLRSTDVVIGWIFWPVTFPVRRGLDLWKEHGI
jgi:predicted tellurium resistance membrane protein TerC